MKKNIILTAVLLLSMGLKIHAQATNKTTINSKEITLEQIWDGTFEPQWMHSLNSMNDDFYSLLNYDRATQITTVDKYSYKTLEKVETIVNSHDLKEIKYISFYRFSEDETKLILGTDFEKIYRHSFKGTFYVFDIASKKLSLVGKAIQEPVFSPDNQKVAFVKKNNLFVKDFTNNTLIKVTKDGKKNSIINGITDWVYEEEFAFVRAFEWSKDSKHIAFLRFDETKVPTFSMDMTGKEKYPTQQVFKYPKAGEKNAIVTLHMYDVFSKESKKISLGDYEYIPRIKWSNDKNILVATTLNRHQNDLKLFKVNALDNTSSLLLKETDKAYINITNNLTFLEDNSFIWTSEKDGYNHIYHYNFSGKLINQVTQGNWEVTKYYGFNEKKNTIYYQSVENGSINRGIYAIGLNGKRKKLLSPDNGQSSADFSENFNYFINTFSSAETPPIYSLYSAKGKQLKIIKENSALQTQLLDYKISRKEFSTIKINGNDLNMWMLKPIDFDENKKYPLLLFQYSGPGSQQVGNRWHMDKDYWHNMLAQKGMIVVCVDGRGTGFKGANFKKITQKELGKYEVEDQIAAAKKLAKYSYIDEENVGIWGWSFGGFMSTNCILKGNDVFSTAIAVAPVTSWRFYDSVYTERYMQTPQENASGYDDNSPINYPEKLKGNYLLVHGTGDDNVHVQNSYRMINSLIEANKQFDMFIVPDRTHGIYKGKNMRLNLYTKMTRFIEQHLLKNTTN